MPSRGTATDRTGVDRRRALKAIGAAGAAGLAGCLGGGGGSDGDGSGGADTASPTATSMSGGEVSLTWAIAPTGSVAHSMGSALSSVLSQQTDITANLKPGPSTTGLSLFLKGDADLAHGTTLIGQRAANREGPFEGVSSDIEVMQTNSFYWIGVGLVAPTSTDLEYYSDLAGQPFNPANSGASFYTPFELALLKTMSEDDIVARNTDISQLSQHLASGKVKAAGGPLYINGIVPGFMQQVYSQNDVRLLAWQDDVVPQIKDDPLLAWRNVENSQFGNIPEFTSSGETFTVVANYVEFASQNVSEDALYTMLDTAWNNLDTLVDSHAAFKPWQDESYWTSNFTTDLPVHPGAAQFLQDKGLWDDKYTVGEV